MPEWLTILIAVVTALGGRELLTAWMTQRARRRVTDAEAAKVEAEATLTSATAGEKTLQGAFQLMDKLKKRQDELEEQVGKQGKQINWLRGAVNEYAERITYLMSGIAVLLQQISRDGKEPCWQPDEWEPPQEEVY